MTARRGGAPPINAGGLDVSAEAEPNSNQAAKPDVAKFNGRRRQDGFIAPTADERADDQVIAAAAARGYRIAVPCIICGSWLTNPRSVAAHVGPVCRKRVAS